MSTITFLESVLGDQGKYCIFAVRKSDKKIRQLFFADIKSAADAADEACLTDFDAYFALGTFDDGGRREARHVVQMRSFFLDLDCGEGKEFSTQVAAINALRSFCLKFKLPKPTMVNSGRGIHAYWPLVEPVSRDVWKPQAERFKKLCLGYGLAIDPVVPADSARVLRVPGTLNFKDDPASRVRVLGELGAPIEFDSFVELLDRYVEDVPVHAIKANTYHNDPVMQAILGNSTSRFKNILEKTKEGKGCAQLAHCVTNQAGIDEPLWRAALSIAQHCEDAPKAIHFVSNRHPDYDPSETQKKAAQTKGPYHCASFESLRPQGCQNCPHRGKITSPIQLGRQVKRAEHEDNIIIEQDVRGPLGELQEYVIPDFPYPYFRGKNGGVYIEIKGADGTKEEVLVYQHDLYVTKRIIDPDEAVGECVVYRLHLPHDGMREFLVPLSAVTSLDELRKHLARNGVAVKDVGAIMAYSIRWVDTLARQRKADVSRKQFGWIDDELTGFALGGMVIHADRVENNPPSSRTAPYFKLFEPKGTLQGWKKTIDFFNRPGFEAYQYALGTGFGAVLSRMTALQGSLLHFYSKESGFGKTTTLSIGASIWGNPKDFVRAAEDTHNSTMLFAETWKDLPVYIDELTNIDGKAASKLVYQITGGKQRDRMQASANGSRWRGEPWSTIFVTSANTSIVSIVASAKDSPQAEAQRVVEIKAENRLKNKKDGDVLALNLTKHYGHAGPIFLQYVMRNLAQVRSLLASVQAKIDAEVGLTSQNRFWSGQAALVITGLYIAKHLKLIDFDMKSLVRWVVEFLKEYKLDESQMVSPSSALELIAEYYFDNVNNFLRIRSGLSAGEDDESTGLDHLITPDANPRIHLLGRHETDTNTLYLMPKPFKKWCSDRQIDYGGVIKDLKTGPAKAKSQSKRLGTGTKLNLPPVSTIRLYGTGWLNDEPKGEAPAQVDNAEAASAQED